MRRRCFRTTLFVCLCAGGLSACWTGPARADTIKPKSAVDPVLHDYLNANGLLNRGLYELAAAEYRKFLEQAGDHEKSPLAHYGLGVCLFRLKKYDEATKELASLYKNAKFEFSAEIGTMLGQCHLIAQRPAKAAQVFKETVQRHGKHDLADDAAAGLVEAMYLAGQMDDAVDAGQDFDNRWPESPLWQRSRFFHGLALLAKKDFGKAAGRIGELLKRFPEGAFADQASLLLAQAYQQNGQADKAIAQYRQIVKGAKGDYVSDALLGLGTLLQQQGDHKEAGDFLDQLLERSPKDSMLASTRLQRGLAWFDQDEFARGYEVLSKVALSDDPLSDQAAYWAAKCKLREGDVAEASKLLGDAMDRFGKSALLPEMIYDRAIAQVRGERLEDAAASLRLFHSRFTDHRLAADVLQLLASVDHQRRAFDESIESCKEFLVRFPSHELSSAVSFLTGENEFLAGRYDVAVPRYEEFLARYSDDDRANKAKFRLGTALYRLRRFDDATPFLTETAAVADDHEMFRPARLALGDIYFQGGAWAQAERYLNDYLADGLSSPSADDALLKLGLARHRQEKHQEAIQAYDRLIDRFADTAHGLQAVFERGQALVELDRLDEAVKAFETVMEKGGDSRFAAYALNHLAAIATQRKDYSSASQLFQRTAQATSESGIKADALFQKAQALMSARQFEAAQAAFEDFLKRYDSHTHAPVARARRAIAIARQDRHADAVEAIVEVGRRDAAQLDPALRDAIHYEKAWCLRELERFDEAAVAYRDLLADKPEGPVYAHALLELAGIELNAKRFESAVVLLGRMRDLLNSDPDRVPAELREQAIYRLAVCEFELERFREAAEVFEVFVEAHPESDLMASARFHAGEAFFRLGRHEDAAKHLTHLADDFADRKEHGPGLLRLGESLAELQHWARSERVFTEYLSAYGSSEHWYQAQFGVGWARENQKRYDEAIDAYRQVTSRHQGPKTARAQFQIGECLFAKQRYDEAVRELLKVDILYAYPEWSAAALYEAARCFEKLGMVVEARAHFKQVVDQHKQTRWAELATQRLTEIAGTGLPGR